MNVIVRPLIGDDLAAVLPDVARLRMSVFRAWPYLYDGDAAYEQRYLQTYIESTGAILIGAFDGEKLVGASTGAPLEDHSDDFGAAFQGQPKPLSAYFYCAESVVLPAYRGQGLGHAFFDARENHARQLGRTECVFCSVQRQADHPARPADYQPLDGFWRKRGYAPLPDVTAKFGWKDLGDYDETEKPMQFWGRSL